MKTKIVQSDELDLAIAFLKKGEPIAFPTETVYGLGASVFQPNAIARIFAIKGRPSDNPLIAHVSSIEQATQLGSDLPASFFHLAEKYWPGPLALVVKRNSQVPSIVSAGQPTIAIRMPKHPIARQLIEAFGEPLAAPSANLSGKPSPTSALDVLEDLEGKIPLIIDGGKCAVGIESTVLSLAGNRPVLLRPGIISREELEEALQQKIGNPEKDGPIQSPGMKYRHYAPKAKVDLVAEAKSGYCLSGITSKTLYAELRKADRLDVKEIAIVCDASIRSDEALMNRLLRAAGQL